MRMPGKMSGPTCPECQGKGYVRIERDGYPFIQRCSCKKEFQELALLKRSGIPPKFWNTTLAVKPIDGREVFTPYRGSGKHGSPIDRDIAQESQKRALQICRKLKASYVDYFLKGNHDQEPVGLLLYGKPGRGKTRLVCSLLRDLIDSGLSNVKFVEYNQLFKQIRQSFNNNGPSYQEVFSPLLNASILAIDDLGTEVTGSTVFLLDQMGYIINERYNKNLPTIFTCNDWVSIREGDSEKGAPESNDSSRKSFEHLKSYEIESYSKEREKQDRVQVDLDRKMMLLEQRVSARLRSRICEMCLEFHIEGFDYRGRIGRNRLLRMDRDALEEGQ